MAQSAIRKMSCIAWRVIKLTSLRVIEECVYNVISQYERTLKDVEVQMDAQRA